MMILSCYISGFGKFVNQGFDFSHGLNLLKADNGFGKTTLADFITAMFYGLDASKNKGLEDNFRLKYLPWSGSAFGGSLVFVYQNRRYTIERSFGKTPSQDTCKLYDENRAPCSIVGGESLGEKLFGVDKESFLKTAYISQTGLEKQTCAPETLLQRLSNIFAQSSQEGDTRAMARLEEAERKLRAKRKPAKGKIDEIEERLEEISLAIFEAENAKKKIGEMQAEIEKTEGAGVRVRQKMPKTKAEKISLFLSVFGLLCFLLGIALIGKSVVFCTLSLGAGLVLLLLARIGKKGKNGEKQTWQKEAEARGKLLMQIELLEKQAENLPLLKAEETELEKEKARLEKRLAAILKAKEFLTSAKHSAAAKYLDPVEQNCKRLCAFLGIDANTLSLNAHAQGSIKEQGYIREMASFSEGQRELFAFCVRLALAEAVFQGELPPLIFDDPFVHFDDVKTEKGKALVREFSKKYQILYFTCKTERKV